jgi:hypothetical protein
VSGQGTEIRNLLLTPRECVIDLVSRKVGKSDDLTTITDPVRSGDAATQIQVSQLAVAPVEIVRRLVTRISVRGAFGDKEDVSHA